MNNNKNNNKVIENKIKEIKQIKDDLKNIITRIDNLTKNHINNYKYTIVKKTPNKYNQRNKINNIN